MSVVLPGVIYFARCDEMKGERPASEGGPYMMWRVRAVRGACAFTRGIAFL